MSRSKVTLLDYGMANLLNVSRALEHCGADVKIVDDASLVSDSDRVVVPGVGAFGQVLAEICARGFDHEIREFCLRGRPLLGICVGMQMLFERSFEFGTTEGLGVLQGVVKEIPRTAVNNSPQRVPHIGWSHLAEPICGREWEGTLMDPFVVKKPAFYFVHSFSAHPDMQEDRLADCVYGGHRICAAVQRENIMATQFHPERSGELGLLLLRRFLEW
jgi:glutamine amidotransferase